MITGVFVDVSQDIEDHVRDFLAAQPVRVAVRSIVDFCAKDMSKLNNKAAYLKGIVKKVIEKEEAQRNTSRRII